ncbi:MAG: hypothetical protein IMZ55_02520 [Acidobacteria bacterium]|nr:hypothetical protein [Planctomycetota bacterium]MBE3132320.1 hypothetical protein [Acidobacteriota bacterium]
MNPNAIPWRRLATVVLAVAALPVLAGARGCQSAAPQRQLTIVMVEYKGDAAGASAHRLAKELTAQGLPETFVVEGANYASVCVGRYDSWKDQAADAMLKRVRLIRDTQGQYPFLGVLLMPVPEPRPASEWPLEEAKGIFTLHVASWESPGRMAAAQQYTEDLRSRNYEAYVYHGPRLSMVTLGAFGAGIFDDPSKVGKPGATPKITDPKVLDLIKKFPRMRLEGQETPADAHVPTQLVKVPGKDPALGTMTAHPRTLYRVSIALVSTKTGLAEGRARAAGVAQSRQEMPTLVGVLVKQLVDGIEGGGVVRAGLVGVLATDADAAREGADAAREGADVTVLQAMTAALRAAGKGKVALFTPEATAQMLDASGLKAADVLRDARAAKGLPGLDYVVVATVTAFSR